MVPSTNFQSYHFGNREWASDSHLHFQIYWDFFSPCGEKIRSLFKTMFQLQKNCLGNLRVEPTPSWLEEVGKKSEMGTGSKFPEELILIAEGHRLMHAGSWDSTEWEVNF